MRLIASLTVLYGLGSVKKLATSIGQVNFAINSYTSVISEKKIGIDDPDLFSSIIEVN